MIDKYIELLLKNRWIVLFGIFLLLLVSLGGLENLKTNYHMRYWLESDDVLIKRLNYFEDNFGNDESVVIAVHSKDGLINKRSLDTVRDLSREILEFEDVTSVKSIVNIDVPISNENQKGLKLVPIVDMNNFNSKSIKKLINSNELIPGLFVSKDFKTLIIFANLKATIINDGEIYEEIDYRKLTLNLRALTRKFKKENFKIHLSGSAILQNDFSAVSEKDLMLIMPLLFAFLSLILFLLFRSIPILIIALGIISLTNTFVYCIAGLLYFEFENLLSIVPLITLTICLADIVHIYMTYQKSRLENIAKLESIKTSIKENFIPTFLTSFTTGLGFFSLYSSKLVPISNMGILAGVGVMIAWLLSISLFPVLLSFGKEKKIKATKAIVNLNFDSIINFSSKWKAVIIPVSLIFALLGAYIGSKNEINTDPISFFKKDAEIRRDTEFILSEMGALSGPEIIIHSGYREGILEPAFLKKVDIFEDWLKNNNYIEKTISIVGLGKELHKALNQNNPDFFKIPDTQEELVDLIFDNQSKVKNMMNLNTRVSSDFESIRLSLLWSLRDTKSSLERLDLIEKKAKDMGLSIGITGKNALYLKMNDYVVDTFFSSIGIAIIFISTLMIFIFKSFKFGLISMIPNVIPLAFITCIMTLTGIHIDIGTALVCSVCLGIAVDDTIHFMMNYYRARKSLTAIDALKNVMDHTGKALLMTSIILVIGFGFFMFSDFIPNIKFGFLCSITIAIALITDFFLLPAVLLKLDK